MATLQLCFLGQFQANRAGQALPALHAPRVQQLLCYLALHSAVAHAREALVEHLWADETAAIARRSLRQVLWQLHGALDEEGASDDPPVLLLQSDTIGFNAAADVWLDVTQLERASAAVREVPGYQLQPDQVETLREAVALYRGELLAGWYQDWCVFERERLQNLYLAMVDKLMGYCEANGHYEAGLEYGANILRLDRARERAHWRLMRLHCLLGDRTAALRQYHTCATALREELDVAPSARTQALFTQIRGGQPLSAPPGRGPGSTRFRLVARYRRRRGGDVRKTG